MRAAQTDVPKERTKLAARAEAERLSDDDDEQLSPTSAMLSATSAKDGDVSVINGAIGESVRALLAQHEQPMRWLCQQIAARTGERELSVPGLIKWLDQPERVLPYRIFAIEEVFELPEGSLSRSLGYLPASAAPPSDVVSAITYDERLSEPSKRALLAAYREMVRGVRTKTVKHRSGAS